MVNFKNHPSFVGLQIIHFGFMVILHSRHHYYYSFLELISINKILIFIFYGIKIK